MSIRRLLAASAAITLLTLGAFALAATDQHKEGAQAPVAETTAADAAVISAQKYSYPLTTCAVSGTQLDHDKTIDVVVDGRLVRVCSVACKDKVAAQMAEIVAKIDAGVVAAQKKDYPLAVCPTSGEKLGEKSVDFVHGTRLVRFCCTSCVADFKKDPTATMAKLDAAYIEAQKKTYPLDMCPVSDEKLGSMGDPIDKLYGTTLVRFCCKGCIKSFEKKPHETFAKLAQARKK